MMKYYFIKNEKNCISGYTETPINDIDGNLMANCIEVEEPSQDILDNFIKYKYDNGFVKMGDEEFKAAYPDFEKESSPTEQDAINAMLMKQIMELKAGANHDV